MITKLGQVMIYVDNQEAAMKFWTEKVGFELLATVENGPMKWYEIAPSTQSETTIIVHNKQLIAEMSPELHLGTPSLLFYSAQFDALFQSLNEQQVTTGPIVDMPTGRVFNFADDENNYFAVAEMN